MNFIQNKLSANSYLLPEVFTHLISQQDYEQLISISVQYFNEKRMFIHAIENGIIKASLEKKEEEVQFGLDNLVRKVMRAEKEKWTSIIYDHYNKLQQDHKSAYTYLLKDLEFASRFLKVLIKDRNFIRADFMNKMVHRVDFPETCTMLILDFEEQFRFLMWDEIKEWETPVSDLFTIALQNIAQEKVSVMNGDFNEHPVYLFLDANFAACYVLDLETNAPNAVGNLGALVAIPTKGAALAHPINNYGVMAVAAAIAPLIMHYYNENEGNISSNFYWYYQHHIEMFPLHTGNDGQVMLRMPKKLEKMLENYR
ncbi:hypothetical protein C7N43_05015 [Sphingobacteriales bacterium UPWRP_1]|nr:hypothetical protein BVG80_06940 [Sphingobacteriales bacterium TSM_CSM]PSJ78182.1 hypothetical protein C7N43_05015 [Sphingobacteriales bacterium UPWRP_1]